MAVNPVGLVVAAVSVVTSGMQQVLCGVVQRKHNLTSNQLLSNTAPIQVREEGAAFPPTPTTLLTASASTCPSLACMKVLLPRSLTADLTLAASVS